jgi:ABC-2 type transport system permease protein
MTAHDEPRAGRLRHGAAVAAVHLRVTAHNELQYRANFFLQLLQSAWQVIGGVVVVVLVYSKTPELNGWKQAELLAAIGVFTMITGLLRAVVYPPLAETMDEIEQGRFDYVLLQPVDAQLLASVRGVNVWQLADVAVGAIIVAVAVPDLPSELGVVDAVAFVAMLGAGAVITYTMWLALSCLAFWMTRLPFMDNLMHYVTRAAQYPISIYPAWLRVSMTVILPLGIAVTAPAEAVTSQLSATTVTSALAVAGVLLVLSRRLWRRGLRRYSGASA